MFYLAKQEIIEIIGTYEWNQATSTFDVFDFFFFLSKVIIMQKLVVHQLINDILSRIIY